MNQSELMRCRGLLGKSILAAAWASTSFGVAGCKVGPDYTRPTSNVSDTWLDIKSRTTNRADDNAVWWKAFNDPALNRLIDQAVTQNLTLRQAGLRVIQARALRGIAVGQFFPQSQAGTGQASNNRVSKNSPAGAAPADRSYRDYSVGLEAAWELDFWGKFRRGIESADASLDASVADYDAALVLLVADVASDYVSIRSIQMQLDNTRTNVKSQQDTLALTQVRFTTGAVSELDVSTARATLSNTQSLIPVLEDSLRQTKLALSVLLGRTPSDLDVELVGERRVPAPPQDIAMGIPADLLRRRPEVRRAERTAAALSAQIGVATADLYPTVTIKGMSGFHTSTFQSPGTSPHAHNLFDANSFEGFVGLDVNWPILNYGRITNNIRVADARYQEAKVAYQQTVLQAAADVEAGLSSFLRGREQAVFLEESVTAAQRTVELSLLQYRQGATDFLRVNQAEVDLVDRQNSLVIARASSAQGAIASYRAMGGGWEIRLGSEFVPRQTVNEMRARTNYGDILAPSYDQGVDFLMFKRPNGGVPKVPGTIPTSAPSPIRQQEIPNDNPK
jgi:NodT family efflux transporter outer membrane factor (OMF) lipoprotein